MRSSGEITISDGCLITVRNISVIQASRIAREWKVDEDCTVEVKTEAQ